MSALKLADFRHGLRIFGPMVDKNTTGILAGLPASENFPDFLYMFWDIDLKIGVNI